MLLGILRNVSKNKSKTKSFTFEEKDTNFLNNNTFLIFLTFDCNYEYLRSCIYNYFSIINFQN